MARASVVLTAAIVLCLSAAGGTGALLRSGASTSSGTSVITSGTAGLTVSTLSLSTATLYPGLTLYGAVTATNTGDVPLALKVSGLTAPTTTSNALSQSLVVGLGAAASNDAASVAACTAGSVTPGWTGTFASAVAGSIGSTLAVGASRVLCVSVTLPLTAPTGSQNLSATGFGLRVAGTQG